MLLGVNTMTCGLRMRRVGLSTVISAAFCSVAIILTGCQSSVQRTTVIDANAPAGQTADPNSGPRMTFEETTHDFGEIVPETHQKGEFKFTNTGKAPLKILNVKPCCGTTIKGVEDGQVYAPGKSGVLEVDYPSTAQPGPVKKYIYLTTNDPAQPIVTLTFKAEIVQQISVEPGNLRLFLRRENGGAGNLTVKSLTGEPFSIVGLASTGNCLKADFDPAVKGTEFVLKLTANMDQLKQHPRGRLEIKLTHSGKKSEYVDYDVLPEFTISPPQVMAFNLKPGQAIQKEIWILGNYDNDFEIESVTSKNGLVKLVNKEKVKVAPVPVVGLNGNEPAEQSTGDHYQYKLKVEITPPQERVTFRDTFSVAIKGGDTLPIELAGFFAAN
jgi:hypothetical protein